MPALATNSTRFWGLAVEAAALAKQISLRPDRQVLLDDHDRWRDLAENAEYQEWLAVPETDDFS